MRNFRPFYSEVSHTVADEFVGSVVGQQILDRGCGDGTYGAELLASGCKAYVGVDESARMIEIAREKSNGPSAEFVHSDMAEWHYPEKRTDLIVSGLALHYVEKLETLFESVFEVKQRRPIGLHSQAGR